MRWSLPLCLSLLLPGQDRVEIRAPVDDDYAAAAAKNVLLSADRTLVLFENRFRSCSRELDLLLRERLRALLSALNARHGDAADYARCRGAAAVGKALLGKSLLGIAAPPNGDAVALEARAVFDGEDAEPRFVRPWAGADRIDWRPVAHPVAWRLDLEGTQVDAALAYLSFLSPDDGRAALQDEAVARAWRDLQPALLLRSALRDDVLLPRLGEATAAAWTMPEDLALRHPRQPDPSADALTALRAVLDREPAPQPPAGLRARILDALRAMSQAKGVAALGELLADADWQAHRREAALWGYLGLGEYSFTPPSTTGSQVVRVTGRTFVEPRPAFYRALLAAALTLRVIAAELDRVVVRARHLPDLPAVDELIENLQACVALSDAEVRGEALDAAVLLRLRRWVPNMTYPMAAEPLDLGGGRAVRRCGWLPLRLPIHYRGERIVVDTEVLTVAVRGPDGVWRRPDGAPFAVR